MVKGAAACGRLAALAVAAAVLLPNQAAIALYHGMAAHHIGGFHHNRGFNRRIRSFAPFGGVIDGYPLDDYVAPVSAVSFPAPLGPVIAPTFSLTCHHSREIVTVPAEAGGTRTITITRC